MLKRRRRREETPAYKLAFKKKANLSENLFSAFSAFSAFSVPSAILTRTAHGVRGLLCIGVRKPLQQESEGRGSEVRKKSTGPIPFRYSPPRQRGLRCVKRRAWKARLRGLGRGSETSPAERGRAKGRACKAPNQRYECLLAFPAYEGVSGVERRGTVGTYYYAVQVVLLIPLYCVDFSKAHSVVNLPIGETAWALSLIQSKA